MKNLRPLMIIASAILIATIMIAGCTDSDSTDSVNTLSTIPTLARAGSTMAAEDTGGLSPVNTVGAGSNQGPGINESAGIAGQPPGGMQINGTRPSGAPADGMQMNGTRPSGTPPGGMQMNGTRPSGTPPSGPPPSGTPPSQP